MGSSPIRNHYHNGKHLHSTSIHSHKVNLRQSPYPRNKRMRRRSPRSRSKLRSNANRARKRTATKTTNAAKHKKLSYEQIKGDQFEDVMDSRGGHYHCRICDQTFSTKSSRGFTSQWNHHRDSAKHQANREALLQKYKKEHCDDISSNNDDEDEEDSNDRESENHDATAAHSDDSEEYEPERNQADTDHEEEEDDQDHDDESASADEQDELEIIDKEKSRKTTAKRTLSESQKTTSNQKRMKPIKNDSNTNGNKRKRKRIKFTFNKHKNRVTAHCPVCNAQTFVQSSGQSNFQLRQALCPKANCGEFWVQIRDNKEVICSKQYPFSSDLPQQLNMNKKASSNTTKKLTLTLNRKRKQPESAPVLADRAEIVIESSPEIQIISPPHKKRRTINQNAPNLRSLPELETPPNRNHNNHNSNTNNKLVDERDDQSRIFKFEHVLKQSESEQQDAYYDSDTGLTFMIPSHSEIPETTNSAESRKPETKHGYDRFVRYNHHNQAYRSKMSHIEMAQPCTRSNCSDFIGGDSHCWIAAPLLLPGNIRMAELGYVYECCWCGKEVQFVEECAPSSNDKKEEKEASNTSTTHVHTEADVDSFGVKQIAHQSRSVHASLLSKWKTTENIPVFPVDGPSYSRVPFSLNDLQSRDRIMASDGTNWLPAWIEQIDQAHNKVLVHFKGWNSRWDKWYNINSGMLKTINEYRKEKKLHSATRNEGIYEIMHHKYPNFVATTLSEEQLNQELSSKSHRNHNHNHKQSENVKRRQTQHRKKRRREKEEIDAHSSSSSNDEDGEVDEDAEHKEQHPEIIDAEIVMMHDKSEVYMAAHELPIHDAHNFILCPPLFYSATSTQSDAHKCIAELVRNCFVHLRGVLEDDADIQLIYKVCESKTERVFYTLHCLKRPERVQSYLKLLKQQKQF